MLGNFGFRLGPRQSLLERQGRSAVIEDVVLVPALARRPHPPGSRVGLEETFFDRGSGGVQPGRKDLAKCGSVRRIQFHRQLRSAKCRNSGRRRGSSDARRPIDFLLCGHAFYPARLAPRHRSRLSLLCRRASAHAHNKCAVRRMGLAKVSTCRKHRRHRPFDGRSAGAAPFNIRVASSGERTLGRRLPAFAGEIQSPCSDLYREISKYLRQNARRDGLACVRDQSDAKTSA